MDWIVDVVLGLLNQAILPDWVLLTAILIISGGAFYVGVLKGKWLPTPVTQLIAKMQKHFVSYESVAPRVEAIVDKFHLNVPFAGWLTKTVTHLLTSVPQLMDAPEEQLASVAASAFVSLPTKKQAQVVPALAGFDLDSLSFVVKRVMTVILMLPQVVELIRRIKLAINNGGPK